MRKFKAGSSFSGHDIAKYRYLKEFSLRKHYPAFENPSNSLQIVLTDKPDDTSPGIIVTFVGVTDLKVGDLSGCTASSIQVEDISSWQLDGTSFQVKDAEDAWFTLNCDDLDVRTQTTSEATGLQLVEAASAGR